MQSAMRAVADQAAVPYHGHPIHQAASIASGEVQDAVLRDSGPQGPDRSSERLEPTGGAARAPPEPAQVSARAAVTASAGDPAQEVKGHPRVQSVDEPRDLALPCVQQDVGDPEQDTQDVAQ